MWGLGMLVHELLGELGVFNGTLQIVITASNNNSCYNTLIIPHPKFQNLNPYKLPGRPTIPPHINHQVILLSYFHRQEASPMLHQKQIPTIWVFPRTEILPSIMPPCCSDKLVAVVVPNIRSRNGIVKAQPHLVVFHTVLMDSFTVALCPLRR